jgi:hypothetical protein
MLQVSEEHVMEQGLKDVLMKLEKKELQWIGHTKGKNGTRILKRELKLEIK